MFQNYFGKSNKQRRNRQDCTPPPPPLLQIRKTFWKIVYFLSILNSEDGDNVNSLNSNSKLERNVLVVLTLNF